MLILHRSLNEQVVVFHRETGAIFAELIVARLPHGSGWAKLGFAADRSIGIARREICEIRNGRVISAGVKAKSFVDKFLIDLDEETEEWIVMDLRGNVLFREVDKDVAEMRMDAMENCKEV